MARKKRKYDSKEMPFLDHLEELRWRIIKCLAAVVVMMIIAFPFSGKILYLLTLPNDQLANPPKLIFLKPTGMLMVRLGIAIAAGLVLSLPIIVYQIWQFVAPGLLEKERRYIWPVILITVACFLSGVAFAYFIMLPFILPFLYSLGTETIQPTININEYIGFVVRIILVTGLVFELPAISFFLSRVGILNPRILRRYRRYAIILIFITAAILTPPDPGSQILLAGPLLILYEISVWVSVLASRRRAKSAEEQEVPA